MQIAGIIEETFIFFLSNSINIQIIRIEANLMLEKIKTWGLTADETARINKMVNRSFRNT
jgi:hypothetical protein